MTPTKRILDLFCAALLSIILAPVICFLYLLIRIVDGGPVFFVSERMKTTDQGFELYKFRTMKMATTDTGVTGGDKANRVTRTGKFLRRSRLDELPQLLNVLKGDISFVGPRPPLRQYVERFPEVYSEVLKSRPGITGLASLLFHKHEERLLAGCKTTEETDAVYAQRCVPRKARLDLLYQNRRTVWLDMKLMVKTVFRSLPLRQRKITNARVERKTNTVGVRLET